MGAPAQAANGAALIVKYSCTLCHGIGAKIVGPAYRDVAAKYHAAPGAPDTLTRKVRAGGSGVWGDAVMPPQPAPSDAELKTILSWILAGAPD